MAYDPSVYDAQRRALTQNYGSNAAMQAYSRFLAEEAAGRRTQDLLKTYQRATPAVMRSYGTRGLAGPRIASGIQRKGLTEFAEQRVRDFSDLMRQQQQEQTQYELQAAGLASELQKQLADLEAEKARQIALDAQVILQQRGSGY